MQLPKDPVILELLPEFVDDWIDQLDSQAQQLLDSANHADLYRMGHTLKGSCFQFSLDDIARKGIALMGMAGEKKFGEAREQIRAIRQAFVDVRNYLNTLP